MRDNWPKELRVDLSELCARPCPPKQPAIPATAGCARSATRVVPQRNVPGLFLTQCFEETLNKLSRKFDTTKATRGSLGRWDALYGLL